MLDKFPTDKTIINPISTINGQSDDEQKNHDPFMKLRKNSTNLYNQDVFEDDHFKLTNLKVGKGIVKKRLSQIFEIGSSINDCKYREGYLQNNWKGTKCVTSKPTYLSQIQMLPEWHYLTLIQPQIINCKGFYHVAVVKEGRIIKKTIDDYVYYDEVTHKIYGSPLLEDKPWVYIVLKVWAKMNLGYDNLSMCKPFSFIRAFTFPDWSIFNPGLEQLQSIINKFSQSSNNDYFYIGKTKNSDKVGFYGLTPDCSSYQITGFHQQYGNIFIKIHTFVGDKWNNRCVSKDTQLPTQTLQLQLNQFIIPLKQFTNIFHLIYYTTNKYLKQKRINYNKFSLNLDARESKAKIIKFQVSADKAIEQNVNLNLYFPEVKNFDLANKRHHKDVDHSIPYCKILLGHQIEQHNNNQGSYADSMREKILNNQGGYFLQLNNTSKYEYIMGDYFKGYANQVTYHLKLKPGRYILRLKIQKIFLQYRAILNMISIRNVNISEGKMNKIEQNQFLAEIFASKSRKQQRNVVFPNPNKKQSWLMLNDDFDSQGYCSILFQVGKNDNRILTIHIDTKKLKQYGYKIKNKSQLSESKYQINLKETQSSILILKYQLQWEGKQRSWPPEGIEISYSMSNLPVKPHSGNL